MDYLVICISALIASGLTLFSGFGLGTLLLPAFALFFPMSAAVAMTAVVHLLNNLFKLALLGRHANRGVACRFGVAAVIAAFAGAALLVRLSGSEPLYTYELLGATREVTPVALTIAVLMIVFALIDIIPAAASMSFSTRLLPLGGILSGFFGGLSGHQGALRSAFLLKCGLTKEAFIGTGVVIACAVDIVRLGVYTSKYSATHLNEAVGPLVAACAAAFLGAFIGARLISKVTMRSIQLLVAVLLIVLAFGLGGGLF